MLNKHFLLLLWRLKPVVPLNIFVETVFFLRRWDVTLSSITHCTEHNDSGSLHMVGLTVTRSALFSDLQLFDDGMSSVGSHSPPPFPPPQTDKNKTIVATGIFLMYHNRFVLPLTTCLKVTSQTPVPPTLKNKAGIMGASSARRVLGSCLVSLYYMSHFHPPKPDKKNNNSLNTVELGPKEAVWIAIIQFRGEREPINIQVSPKHQMFSLNKYWEGWCSSGSCFLHVWYLTPL